MYLDDFGKKFPSDVVVSLQKHFTETAFSDRVIFGVEFVETMKCVAILVERLFLKNKTEQVSVYYRKAVNYKLNYRMNVQHVDSQII